MRQTSLYQRALALGIRPNVSRSTSTMPKRRRARGLGVLFITHDLSLGNYVSERTMIMRRGEIVEVGPTDEVLGNPQHPYSQALVAAVPQLHERWHDRATDVPTTDRNQQSR